MKETPKLMLVVHCASTAMIVLVVALCMGTHSERLLAAIAIPIAIALLLTGILHMKKVEATIEEQEARTARMELTDLLTDLGNRLSLIEHIENLSTRGAENQIHALLVLDVNNFRHLNDTYGHQAGDDLLRQVGSRLTRMLPYAFVARTGGNEFAVLGPVPNERIMTALCANVSAVLRQPFHVDAQNVRIRTSLGAVIVRPRVKPPPDLLRDAGLALDHARSSGVPYCLFESFMVQQVQRNALVERRLRAALEERSGIDAYFQPILSAAGTVVGLEALVRSDDPELGSVTASEIVISAERAGLAHELTMFVADRICDAAKAVPGLTMGLNVTIEQLREEDFASRLAQHFTANGIAPDQVQLELTEDAFARSSDELRRVLRSLNKYGFILAVDDFGTSNAGIAYLRHAHVRVAKLDRSLLLDTRRMGSVALMAARVHLAKSLGVQVVCEGVSDEEELNLALEIGCDFVQGYHLAPPMPLGELVPMLQNQQPPCQP